MTFAGSVLAGVSWIVVLSALLWNTGEDAVLPALLLDFHSRTFPYPFTIQNLMWIVFFVGAGELLLRHVAGTAEGRQLNRALLPEDDGRRCAGRSSEGSTGRSAAAIRTAGTGCSGC